MSNFVKIPHRVRLNHKNLVLIFNFFKNIIVFFALLPVYFYRLVIRPLLPKSCKFFPTCSQYAIISIKRFGAIKGWWMASKRLIRCQPFSKSSGYDPVPYHLKGGAKWIV